MKSEISETLIKLVSRAAAAQGGIIDGDNPAAYNTNDPIRLWVIQVGIIVIFTHILSFPLSYLRQPRVCAEVIGGIILGPTIMGRIPGFTDNIFPQLSLSYLNLTSTIALVLFLFLVGLEIDTRTMGKNIRSSLAISTAGMIIPFGLGAAIAVPVYNNFVNKEVVTFGHFLLFQCVALSITAFPVLCRILTELKLLDTTVGVVVLASGVGNDVVGWILLALTVALVNASSGLSALWILLTGIGWVLFMLIPVKWAFHWAAKRTGSLETGVPTPLMMTLTLLTVFISAFFTDIIGIHPIFGGFLAGLIIPHDGGFAISIVEKIEDLVTILLLPIYFTLSGLKTDLGLLDNGITWAYTILLIAIAFVGKFVGCAGAAKLTGFDLRESGAIGALMSCKGLVELIVLNIGFQAGILDTRLFSMFVVMALILTLLTTPLTLWIYPASVRKLIGVAKPLAPSSGGSATSEKADPGELSAGSDSSLVKTRFSVVLERIEHLPAIMSLIQLVQPSAPTAANEDNQIQVRPVNVKVAALRLIELTDRTSAVMRGSDSEDLLHRDALVKVVQTFGRLNRVNVSASLSVVPQSGYASSVTEHASATFSDLIVLPWSASLSPGAASTTNNEGQSSGTPVATSTTYNPFQALFGQASPPLSPPIAETSVLYSQFIRQVFAQAATDVALLVDTGRTSTSDATAYDGQHIYLPFFGGPDDRLALSFIAQLCTRNLNIRATIVRLIKSEEEGDHLSEMHTRDTIDEIKAQNLFTITSASPAFPDTIYGHATTETRMNSRTADDVLWTRLNPGPEAVNTPNLVFGSITSSKPLHAALNHLQTLSASAHASKSILVVTGRARRLAVESHEEELRELAQESKAAGVSEIRKTVGDVASAFVLKTTYPLLVLQAHGARSEV